MAATTPTRTHAQSLGKNRRLSKPSQFKAVFSNATRSHAGIFSIRSRANACDGPRLGLAVSVKAAGNAVARNRLKRLVRESFRRHRLHLPAHDYVVACKPGSSAAERARAMADLALFWEKEAAARRKRSNDG